MKLIPKFRQCKKNSSKYIDSNFNVKVKTIKKP